MSVPFKDFLFFRNDSPFVNGTRLSALKLFRFCSWSHKFNHTFVLLEHRKLPPASNAICECFIVSFCLYLEKKKGHSRSPCISFGSSSHPVLSHAPFCASRSSLGISSASWTALIVPWTPSCYSSRQSAKV